MAGIRKDGDGQILEKDDVQVKRPQRYTCVLHNDNYTTQDFVVFILQKIFKLDLLMARSVMLKVHIHGKGNVGIIPTMSLPPRLKRSRAWPRRMSFP
jgi:ATP-dependent Clp protease adaptor protein ClpS